MNINKLIRISSSFDIIDRVEGLIFNFINGEWKKNKKKYGWFGVARTILSCLTEKNIYEFKVSRECVWSGVEIERLLKRNGIKLGNRGVSYNHDDTEYYFFWVKRRQQKWAEYVMMRNNIPVKNVKDMRNHAVGAKFNDKERDPSKLSKRKR